MNIQIHPTNDSQVVAKLNEAVQVLHHQLYPNEFKAFDFEAISKAIEKMMDSPQTHTFLATIDAAPVGYILCMVKTRAENEFQFEKEFLYIDQISVNEASRKLGVGKLLMRKAMDLAKDLGTSEIQLDHWSNNREAGEFFEQFGFEYFNFKMKMNSGSDI